ncbi:MAG: ABC transporter permease [Streptococcaceae bacterium]|jgi:oligopeptide transport system permease protein|nr:ABC transporter permease [Streptococcaceae bacterium]
MKKYIFFRIVRSLLSVVIVTAIVYALIFSLIPRRAIFVSDQNYSKIAGNLDKRKNYENTIYEKQGYIDYLTPKELLTKIQKTTPSYTSKVNQKNLATAKKYLDTQKGVWKLDELPTSRQIIATREIPLLERVAKFYGNLIQIDHPWKIQDKSNPKLKRYLKLAWEDGLVIKGSGTEHKYLLYFDKKLPFIHQNFITLNLGESYPTFGGRSVSDVLTSGQGETVSKEVTMSDGSKMFSSLDPHTATYQPPKTQSKRQKAMYDDDYTNLKTNYQDPSMLQNSFTIAGLGTILAYLIAIPAGALMARHSGKFIDRFGLILLSSIVAIPSLALIYFNRLLGSSLFGLPDLFTTYGAGDVRSYILPIIVIAMIAAPSFATWTRRYMTDQRSSDYVKFARAKGLSEKEISRHHVMKNALIPIVNGIPGAIISAFAGATMTETIFLVPGMGKMLPDAIAANNNSMIVGITFVFTLTTVLAVLVGDILMQYIDPRIKLSTQKGGK